MNNDNCAVKIAVRERPARENLKNCHESSVINYHSSGNVCENGNKQIVKCIYIIFFFRT